MRCDCLPQTPWCHQILTTQNSKTITITNTDTHTHTRQHRHRLIESKIFVRTHALHVVTHESVREQKENWYTFTAEHTIPIGSIWIHFYSMPLCMRQRIHAHTHTQTAHANAIRTHDYGLATNTTMDLWIAHEVSTN